MNSYLVFTSNIFAILGLRLLYFVLASMLDRFHYLKSALIFILAFIGVKMLILQLFHLLGWVSLVVVVAALTVGVVASLRSEQHAGDKEILQF